jgi:hypothetical protein
MQSRFFLGFATLCLAAGLITACDDEETPSDTGGGDAGSDGDAGAETGVDTLPDTIADVPVGGACEGVEGSVFDGDLTVGGAPSESYQCVTRGPRASWRWPT